MKKRRRAVAILAAAGLMLSTVVNLPARAKAPGGPKTEQHNFTLGAGERVKFGFVAKKAGAISAVVNVNSQSPVSVSLAGPQGLPPVTKQGRGEIKLDVASGSFADNSLWFVSIEEPVRSTNNLGRPVANGTVSISYVPADKSVVEQLNAAKRAEMKRKLESFKSRAGRQANSAQLLAARRAALEKERNQRHAAQKERALHRVHLVGAGRGQTAGGQHSRQPARQSTQQTTYKGRVNPNKERTAADARMSIPKGSNVKPQIASLDVTEGDPGTPVVITGTNFGSVQGEVHFIINPNMDVAAPVEQGTWSDTQVMAYVPDASGLKAFNGQVYVKMAGGGPSALTPFHFLPAMDTQYLPLNDQRVQAPADGCGSDDGGMSVDGYTAVVSHQADCSEGYKGDDSFLEAVQKAGS